MGVSKIVMLKDVQRGCIINIVANGSYMKRGFDPMLQVATNLSSHVLYTVLVAAFYIIDY
jgi:hypothetical protein